MKLNSKIILVVILLLSIATYSCKDDDEFNREHIPGEYTGNLIYWHTLEEGGAFLGSSDPSKGDEFKTTVKRVGSNYILSFDKSFIYKIPDITVEITQTNTADVYAITTLPGQVYNSAIKQHTYMNQPSNYFSISKYPQVVFCDLTLRSNDPDSTYFLEILIHRIY